MASPQAQARAEELNTKLGNQARIVIDEMEKEFLRPRAQQAYRCSADCYNDKSSTATALDQCVRECQTGTQHANAVLQNEVNNYQNRLNRAMNECQDKARDTLRPGDEGNARKMQKAETALLQCMEKTVGEYVGLLKPLRQRVAGQFKK